MEDAAQAGVKEANRKKRAAPSNAESSRAAPKRQRGVQTRQPSPVDDSDSGSEQDFHSAVASQRSSSEPDEMTPRQREQRRRDKAPANASQRPSMSSDGFHPDLFDDAFEPLRRSPSPVNGRDRRPQATSERLRELEERVDPTAFTGPVVAAIDRAAAVIAQAAEQPVRTYGPAAIPPQEDLPRTFYDYDGDRAASGRRVWWFGESYQINNPRRLRVDSPKDWKALKDGFTRAGGWISTSNEENWYIRPGSDFRRFVDFESPAGEDPRSRLAGWKTLGGRPFTRTEEALRATLGPADLPPRLFFNLQQPERKDGAHPGLRIVTKQNDEEWGYGPDQGQDKQSPYYASARAFAVKRDALVQFQHWNGTDNSGREKWRDPTAVVTRLRQEGRLPPDGRDGGDSGSDRSSPDRGEGPSTRRNARRQPPRPQASGRTGPRRTTRSSAR